MIGTFMAMGKGNVVVEEDLLRHTVLNTIRQYKQQFSHVDHGGFVICCDSAKNWRKDSFPEYNANRKTKRENDTTDWKSLFEFLHELMEDFRTYFPYKVMKVERAEADDIIGLICEEFHYQKIMIISGDKDFIQLQKYPFVQQWSPITKKAVNGYDPDVYIQEHILKGDTSDGIPNVLSPDNTFTEGLRQRPLSRKKIESWVSANTKYIPTWSDEVKRNYQRNYTLIDLTNTPEDIEDKILKEYKNAPSGNRSKLLNYFMKYKLRELTENIGEF